MARPRETSPEALATAFAQMTVMVVTSPQEMRHHMQ